MKNYVKAILYVYPRLRSLSRDMEEHIRNRAFRSHRSCDAERLAEELAEEIVGKRLTEDLTELMDGVIGGLSDREKLLLEVRYFRRKRELGRLCGALGGCAGGGASGGGAGRSAGEPDELSAALFAQAFAADCARRGAFAVFQSPVPSVGSIPAAGVVAAESVSGAAAGVVAVTPLTARAPGISRRSYFRRQSRLLEKIARLLRERGLTEREFFRDYMRLDWMSAVYRQIEAGKCGASAKERSLLAFLSDSRA